MAAEYATSPPPVTTKSTERSPSTGQCCRPGVQQAEASHTGRRRRHRYCSMRGTEGRESTSGTNECQPTDIIRRAAGEYIDRNPGVN
jgi:hypothetical protein